MLSCVVVLRAIKDKKTPHHPGCFQEGAVLETGFSACVNLTGSSLKLTGATARDVCGTRGRGASPGLLGLACLVPAALGSSCCPRAAAAGAHPAPNISRNAPQGRSQRRVGGVASVRYGEEPRRGDVLRVCVSIPLGFGVSPASPAVGWKRERSPGLPRTSVGSESGSVLGPRAQGFNAWRRKCKKDLSDYTSNHLNPKSESKLLNVSC